MSRRSLRVGIVCPYSFDVPGGVQFHVRDLASALTEAGHQAEVLAPADDDTPLPPHVVAAGKAIPIRYNGSVARLAFGPVVAARVRRWLAEGEFDLLHIHEPATPSVSILALWATDLPVVATFHSSQTRSRALQIASPMIQPALEKIGARIAVSEEARRTVIQHLGGDAVVIPNGVYVDTFAGAPRAAQWESTRQAPTIAFLGRLDEPRKGLDVLVGAVPELVEHLPGLRVLVAGRGDDAAHEAARTLGPLASHLEFLGSVTDQEKESLLASVRAYIAPQTGGESFGIVLVEAMSAGAAVVASKLPAFTQVLADGRAGRLFDIADSHSLAQAVIDVVTDDDEHTRLVEAGHLRAREYDWSTITARIVTVYDTVLDGEDALDAVTGAVAKRRPEAASYPGEMP